MTGNNINDAKRMFKHACAFSGCARFCTREPWDVEHRLPDYSVAGIVNSAFACEVFLKSLLVYQGLSIEDIRNETRHKGHNLVGLWRILEDKDSDTACLVKGKIRELFNKTSEEKFFEMLESVSDAFSYWRYIYEKSSGTIHVNFLDLFRVVLKEVCCEKYYGLTWKEYTKGFEDEC